MSLRHPLMVALIAFVFLVSCSNNQPLCDDACATGITQCTEGKQRQCESVDGCARWSDWTPCAIGVCASATICKPCDTCPQDATECIGGKVRACVTDANECRIWGEWSDCASGFCSNEVCGDCNHACPALGATECSSGRTRTCQVNTEGCFDWSDWSDCTSSSCANGSTCGACTHTCSSVGATECTGGQIRTCQADANNCRTWSGWTNCAEGMCHDAMLCNGAPVAVLACPTSAIATQSVTFDASGSSDPDGDLLTYAFTFGDGTPGSGGSATVQHTFASAGSYTITLTVEDPAGATSTDSCILTVSPLPHPDMLISTDTQLCGVVYAGRFSVQGGATVSCPTGELTVYADDVSIDPSSTINLSGTSSSPGGVEFGVCYEQCDYLSRSYAWVGGGGGGGGAAGSASNSTTGICGSPYYQQFPCPGVAGGSVLGNNHNLSSQPGSAGGRGCASISVLDGTCYTYSASGNGGGSIKLVATRTMSIMGQLLADGADGADVYGAGAGGGGGGSIVLVSPGLTISGTLSVAGGQGGVGNRPNQYNSSTANGGNGAGGRVKLAYGPVYSNTGTINGAASTVESVMPPTQIGSPTHPNSNFTYNDLSQDIQFSWLEPYAGVQGYWYAFNQTADFALTPSNGTFTAATLVRLPANTIDQSGTWYFHIISTNASAISGTVANRFPVTIQRGEQTLSSSSHPNESNWYMNTTVTMSWTPPSGLSADSYRGYWYRLDRVSNSNLLAGDEGWTYTTNRQVLLTHDSAGQAISDFSYHFHLVSEDTMGNLGSEAAHFRVQIGTAAPATSSFYGYVQTSGGAGIDGASVRLEPYGLTQTTDSNGYFLFTNVFEGPYTLTVSRAGYQTLTQLQEVSASASPVSLVP